MLLKQRLNWTLLPVILAVFILAATLSIVETWQNSGRYIDRRLAIELHNYQAQLAEQAVLLDSGLHLLLSYRVVRDLDQVRGGGGDSMSLQYLIQQFRSELKQILPNLEMVQLYTPDGRLLVAADGQDPFAPQVRPHIPAPLRWWAQPRGEAETGPAIYLYRDSDGEIQLALLEGFVPEVQGIRSESQRKDNRTFYALLTVSLPDTAGQQLLTVPGLATGLRFQIQDDAFATPRSESRGSLRATLTGNVVSDNGTALSHTPLYSVSLSAKEGAVWRQSHQLIKLELLLTLILVFLTYWLLRGLIQQYLVKPVLTLAGQVRSQRSNSGTALQTQRGDDEIALLNNAYVELMSDVQQLASFDALTGLANRRTFQSTVDRLLARKSSPLLALLYIDLDNFKRVNDSYGHDVGDSLLREYTRLMCETLRSTDPLLGGENGSLLARLGGDEFALVLSGLHREQDAVAVAKRLLAITRHGIRLDGVCHRVHASVGIALAPRDARSTDALMRCADSAMYQAKLKGKGRCELFSTEIAQKQTEQSRIEQALQTALEQGLFHLEFQPIFTSQGLKVTGLEALIRSSHPDLASIGPDRFIPIAESTGLIRHIDSWVLLNGLKTLSQLRRSHGFDGLLCINLSAVELHNTELLPELKRLLGRYRLPPDRVELEITETMLVDADDNSVELLASLRRLEVGIALDDFGTGYTSFNQLLNYPVTTLKIDRSFIAELGHSHDHKRPMVELLLELAGIFNLETVAEGVENDKQFNHLKRLGCDRLQGYYLGKPLRRAQLEQFLTEHGYEPVQQLTPRSIDTHQAPA